MQSRVVVEEEMTVQSMFGGVKQGDLSALGNKIGLVQSGSVL